MNGSILTISTLMAGLTGFNGIILVLATQAKGSVLIHQKMLKVDCF